MNGIPSLDNYKDWFEKAKSDFQRLDGSNEIYDFVDCLLTLNALPEWIFRSDSAPSELRKLAEEKCHIMMGMNGFEQVDEEKLENNIDHQLRFIRLFCNHAKHGKKKQIPIIQKEAGNTLPAEFPVEFEMIIKIGNKAYNAKNIIYSILQFWRKEIEEN